MTKIIKLTDSQLKVLAAAAERADGAASVPEKMKAAAASKIAQALIGRKLMREIRTKPGMPVWRRDEEARCFSLVIMSAGRKALEMLEAPNSEQMDFHRRQRRKRASPRRRLRILNVPGKLHRSQAPIHPQSRAPPGSPRNPGSLLSCSALKASRSMS
jgi:hypothetical protein